MNATCGGNGDQNTVDLVAWRLRRRASEMIHSEIRALYSYWDALRGDRPCSDRHEIDPREMPADARHVFLLEDLGGGNVRFRLAGSALGDAFGFDLGGMSAKAIFTGRSRESFVALVAEALAEPAVGYLRLLEPDGRTVWEMVLLPLRGPFGQIDRMLGCLHPVSGRIRDPLDAPLRFTIEHMALQPVLSGAEPAAPGFAETQSPFRAIEGGRRDEADGASGVQPKRPPLRVVRDDADEG